MAVSALSFNLCQQVANYAIGITGSTEGLRVYIARL
jgi:hypothetical protein